MGMAEAVLSWLFAMPLLGFVTGLRTMTPMAVICWFAYRGDLPLDGTWAEWASKLPAAIMFSLLAIGELVADKVPKTLRRIDPVPLGVRLFVGGLMGAIVAAGLNGSGLEGGMLGVLGALTGAFCGYYCRKEIVNRLQYEDWHVALLEDALAIGCTVFAMGIVTG